MPDKLNALLERLKAHQRTLILAMAEYEGLPAGSALRQVAELENVIAAVEAVRGGRASPAGGGGAGRRGPGAGEPLPPLLRAALAVRTATVRVAARFAT